MNVASDTRKRGLRNNVYIFYYWPVAIRSGLGKTHAKANATYKPPPSKIKF